jgi:hypothetical protein
MVKLYKFHTEYPQMLGATAQNLVATATCRPRFVRLCVLVYVCMYIYTYIYIYIFRRTVSAFGLGTYIKRRCSHCNHRDSDCKRAATADSREL